MYQFSSCDWKIIEPVISAMRCYLQTKVVDFVIKKKKKKIEE